MSDATEGGKGRASRWFDWGGAQYVLLGVIVLSFVLAVMLWYRYSQVMGFIKRTLDEPELPLPWEDEAYSPEDCVDWAMAWAASCTGIKSMCDMYVDRAMLLCLESRDRRSYCAILGERSETTEFGVPECRARGVQRDLNKEACAIAYRTIDGYCKVIRRRVERGALAPVEAREGSQ
jgi:hypothetical protein